MDAFISFFTQSPIPLALAGSYFLCYALVAWGVLLARALTGRFTRPEWAVFAVFTGAVALEAVQLAVTGFNFLGRSAWGLPRYFGVFAPFLWLWAAKALADLWALPTRRTAVRWTVRALIVAALGWVLLVPNLRDMAGFYRAGARADTLAAARRIVPVIQADYAGPARQTRAKRTLDEYFTTRRPVVFSDFAAAAWLLRGQSEGANQGFGLCPYPDDYLFIRVGSGYGKIETVDARQYDYLGSVPGLETLGTEWRLFRRKSTPHR